MASRRLIMPRKLWLVRTPHFDYGQSMIAHRPPDEAAARIAEAIGEPARARMLYRLLDGHARTSTELALVAGVSPSTASTHLARLLREGLVRLQVQGKHRYYGLTGPEVAAVLETLSGLTGGSRGEFVPGTPEHLRAARSCYDHLAGTLGVALHDRLLSLEWIARDRGTALDAYAVTARGGPALSKIGVDVEGALRARRRFAFACLDWSERRAHVGGAIGAALLTLFLTRRWLKPARDTRALEITGTGRREFRTHWGIRL